MGALPEVERHWLSEVRSLVDARLARFFETKREHAAGLAEEAPELVDAVSRLTLRGGKRFRPALLTAAYLAVDPDGAASDVVDAGAALELMQSYLLIHDDWMDGDDERRGGPSVHAALSASHDDTHLGASLSILAGNLASAQAWELLSQGPWKAKRGARAVKVFLEMHQEVVFGQQLDLLATERVAQMQQLKTGSYTVRGPLRLGAVLAGADDAQLAALETYGRPLGEAFQIRDDLLGTFGDARATGKPTGNDLRAGKRTALLLAAEGSATDEALAPVRAVLGREDANDEEIAQATAALEACGARNEVERRLERLVGEASAALEGTPLGPRGRDMLGELATRLSVRDR